MPLFSFNAKQTRGKPMNATETLQALSSPFDPADVHFKPQHVSGNRCLAVAYLDARAVMDRLDAVCGLNWSDAYEVLPGGSVLCRLQILVDGQWITKTDVGSPSEQPDEGDRMKAAFSDALKRAAVKFGVARYLYHLPKQWVEFDPQRKQIKAPPQLPVWALPAKGQPAATVTHEQARELQRLLQADRRLDPAKFLAWCQVTRLTEIPAGLLGEALAALKDPPTSLRRDAA
jgi:hypothetical protein